MKKHATKRNRTKGARPKPADVGNGQLTLAHVLLDAQEGLRDLVTRTGLGVFQEMLENERLALCGPRNSPQEGRTAYRYGSTEGELVFGGRKITLPRPRVRSTGADGGKATELRLETWDAMRAEDPLSARMLEQMLVGVSTRKYERSLEPVAPELRPHTTSRSSVSRRFKARTAAQVDEFLSRRLDDLDLPVIMIDGKHFGEHVMLIALGIDAGGHKHPLAVVEGTTESEGVCLSLLRSLVARGLAVERARLFVIDGAKGVRKAIRTVFGEWALVQRCQVHKTRNVLEHLPKRMREWMRSALRKAYRADSRGSGRRQLNALADQLESKHPGAAASIREGLDETLTVIELGLSGWLYRTLCSTNPIENVVGTLDHTARNVKRWRSGEMAQRWAVTGLIEASGRFRRIKGYADLPALVAALEAKVRTVDSCTQVA